MQIKFMGLGGFFFGCFMAMARSKGMAADFFQAFVAFSPESHEVVDVAHEFMNLPGFDFHPLKGERKGQYAVTVQKNWRVVFKFDGVDAYDVDYLDYH